MSKLYEIININNRDLGFYHEFRYNNEINNFNISLRSNTNKSSDKLLTVFYQLLSDNLTKEKIIFTNVIDLFLYIYNLDNKIFNDLIQHNNLFLHLEYKGTFIKTENLHIFYCDNNNYSLSQYKIKLDDHFYTSKIYKSPLEEFICFLKSLKK